MSKRERKFWKSYLIAMVFLAVTTVTVLAFSLFFDGSSTFTTMNTLSLSFDSVGASSVISDVEPAGLLCGASRSGDRWITTPDESSVGDQCTSEFNFTSDMPVYVGAITQDALAAGIIELTTLPACGSLIPAGAFTIDVQSEILPSAVEGTPYDFFGFQLEFSPCKIPNSSLRAGAAAA